MNGNFRASVAAKKVGLSIFLIFVSISIFSLFFSYAGLAIQSSVRAYVAGEGLWSKAQRDATYYLHLYAETQDAGYYSKFKDAITIPQGLRIARLELLKPEFDETVATQALLTGGTHPDDVAWGIRLLRCCAEFKYFKEAIANWEIGDRYITKMEIVAIQIRREIETGSPSPATLRAYLDQVAAINEQVKPFEAAFTSELGDGARAITQLIFVMTSLVVGGLISLGAYLSFRMARNAVWSEEQYRLLFNSASDAFYVFDRSTRKLIETNNKGLELTKKDAGTLYGTNYSDLFLAADGQNLESGVGFRLPLLQADGARIPVEVSSSAAEWYGKPVHLTIVRDISAQLHAESMQRISANAMANMAEGIVITDKSGRVVTVNHAFSELTGFAAEDVLNRLHHRIFLRHDRRLNFKHIVRTVIGSGAWRGEVRATRKDNTDFMMQLSVGAVKNEHGQIENFITVFSDISESKNYEKRLLRMASHDTLTQLPNREAFYAHFEKVIAETRDQHRAAALLFVDLDGFKLINDTYGHAVGDVVLCGVAEILTGCVRPDDYVARLGGDEFTVLLTDVRDATEAAAVAGKLLTKLAKGIATKEMEFTVLASIGISLCPHDGATVEGLLTMADTAMYEAKHRGRNNFQFYELAMTVDATSRFQLFGALKDATSRNEFELFYQPCVDLANDRIVGIEALIRWNHPELGMIAPDRFISLAEETGLIGCISDWVIVTVCQQITAWKQQNIKTVPVAINISPYNFWNGKLPQDIRTVLASTGCPPEMLCVEITENAVMNRSRARSLLNELNEIGVQIAFDDFGMGYSSLSYLKDFPVQYLKIDRSFMISGEHDESNAAIIRTIVALARSLRLKVIAEGVENEAQKEFLRREGCDEAQGYLFGRPMPVQDIAALLIKSSLLPQLS